MSLLAKVHKQIEKYKEKLEQSLFCENFGQKEVRELREKYDIYTLSEISVNERNQIMDAIDYFDEWCQTYSPKEIEQER